jgi:KDO2-lipid IV(A) lauroyltransferase
MSPEEKDLSPVVKEILVQKSVLNRPLKKVRYYLEYLGLRVVMAIIARMPVKLSLPLFASLGWLAWYLAPRRRKKIALENLKRCFPEWNEAQRVAVARKSLQNAALFIPEFLAHGQLRHRPERFQQVEGFEHIDGLLKSGRGFFIGSAHFGNWGMLWTIPLLMKPGGIIVKRLMNPYVDALVDRMAAELGNVRIADRSTGDAIVAAVKEGRVVGFYLDQAALPHLGKPVNFMGHPAYTHLVPFYLALKHDIPFIPIFAVRTGLGRGRMVIRPPLPALRTEDKIGDLVRMAEAMNRELEAMVREYPEQWLWMHDRWKRAPEKLEGKIRIDRKISDSW